MERFNWKHALAMIACSAIFGLFATQIVMGIGSIQLSRNSGHEHFSYPDFFPRVQVIASLAATAEDVSIYCPGIRLQDRIFMCIEIDSAANALASTVVANLTDSTYIWADDSIRSSQAIGVNSDLIVGWHRSNQ